MSLLCRLHDRAVCDVQMSIRDSNVSLNLREVDYLILFEFCEMRNAERNQRCSLRNVPQVKFRKIRLFKCSHSAFRKVHLPNSCSIMQY